MARYIDADKVMEEIYRIGGHNLCEWDTIGVKALIDRQPTADVAPKSEVDRLEAEVRLLTENSILAKYPCCVSCSKGLILTKSLEEYDKLLADISSEVAREIFEEIEKIIDKHHGECYEYEDGDECDTAITYISYISCDIDELKNKYTEEKE